ncbi:MAG: tyrosine-protein phosphatase [Firmicutes bacterium]|nr:tyrosine-protein phosphatase [Bacillota bacterium]
MNFRDHINFRDLGGYKSLDGRHIKPGLLYRSGGLYLMNQEETEYFLSLGIRHIMDFRTKEETDAHPDPVFPGIEMIRHSGITTKGGEEIDFSPTGMSQIGESGINQLKKLKEYYRNIPFDNDAFKNLMAMIVAREVPLVFHCYTGKDRTGVFAIVLLLALGIDEETVMRDFMLSNYYHRDALLRALNDGADKFEEHPEVKELLTMWFGVSEDVGREVISEIKTRYGSPEEYFIREYGLDEDSLWDLRDFYLE